MSHKDAPPLTQTQSEFEAWWLNRYKDRGVTIAFGRDKKGQYLAEFTRDAWEAWWAAREQGKIDQNRMLANAMYPRSIQP